MGLREVQERFSAVLYSESPDGEARKSVAAQFAVQGNISPAEGLEIYRRNLVFSLVETLEKVYPATVKALSPDNFRFMARRYVYATPSSDSNLDNYGSDFGDYLDGADEITRTPWIADLARLEWQWNCIPMQPTENIKDISDLVRLIGDDPASITLCLPASICLLSVRYAVAVPWEHLLSGDDSRESSLMLDPVEQETHYLIASDGDRQTIEELSAVLFKVLQEVREGCSLQDLIEGSGQAGDDEERAQMAAYLVGSGWVAAVE